MRKISIAVELYVEAGRVSHNWCMCVAGHGYGGLGGIRDEGGGWHAYGTKLDGFVACREMPE